MAKSRNKQEDPSFSIKDGVLTSCGYAGGKMAFTNEGSFDRMGN